MKKILAILIGLIFIITAFSGCDDKVVVSKEPIDFRFTAAHEELVTDYYWIDDYYVHDSYVIFKADKYEVKYHITYEDGSNENTWLEVDLDEYNRARDKLP